MAIEEVIYQGRNNAVMLSLTKDGVAIAHNTLTRCQAMVGTTLLDSTVTPALFDLTQIDRLVLKFGQAGLAIGRYAVLLTVYDAANTSGIVWGEFALVVK